MLGLFNFSLYYFLNYSLKLQFFEIFCEVLYSVIHRSFNVKNKIIFQLSHLSVSLAPASEDDVRGLHYCVFSYTGMSVDSWDHM